MSEELISQYVDRAAIADDTSFLKKNLSEVLALLKTVNETKINLGGTTTMKGLNAGSDDIKKQLESLLAENKKLKVAFDEVATKLEALTQKRKKGNEDDKKGSDEAAKAKQKLLFLYTDEAKVQAAAREEIRKRNADLKDQAREENTVLGSLNQAILANKRLRKERGELDLSTEEGTKRLKQLNDEIDKNTEFITRNNDQYTQRKINIGNYVGAAQYIVDALSNVRKELAETQQAQSKFTFSLPSTPASGNSRTGGTSPRAPDPGPARELSNYSKAAEQTADKVIELQKQEEILSRIVAKNSEGFASATAELKSNEKALQNLEKAGLKNTEAYALLLKDTAELKDSVGDLKQEINALSSDTRAFDLFASSISFIASTFQAAAGAAVALGASEEDAAEATKNLVAIENVANGVRGVANELTTKGTAANKLYTYVQRQAAIATDTTASATARLKAALISLGIGALIVGIGLLIANFSKIKDLLSSISRQQKLLNQINKEAIDGYVKEKVAVGLLVQEVNAETTSKRRKKEIIEELNEISPVYFGGIKTEKDLIEKLPAAYAKYTEALILSAKVKAAESILQGNEQKRLLDILDKEEKLAARRKQFASFPDNIRKQSEANDLVIKELTADIADLNKEADETGGIITRFVLDTKKQLNSIGGEVKGNTFKSTEELLQDIFEASRKAINNRATLEKDAATRQLAELKKSFEERKILEGQFLNRSRSELKTILSADLAVIQTNLDLQLAAAGDNLTKRKSAEDDARTARILAERDFQDRLTELLKEAEQRRRKIISSTVQGLAELVSPELSKMAQALDQITGNSTVEKLEAWVNAFKTAKDSILTDIKELKNALGGQLLEAFNTLVGFTFENQKNAIQEQIDKLEEKKQKEIEVVNSTITNEQDKAARIATIESLAQAEREKLERQQRQVGIQKAKFEKAAALLQIAVDTFQKVAAIKAQAALLLANPLTAVLAPLALSQIPLVIGSGAVAAALIAARPIPKYKYGRKGGDATFAHVGDGGRQEVIYSPDNSEAMITPATDTLTYIPQGYGVAPSIEDFHKLMMSSAHGNTPTIVALPVINDNSELIKAMAREIQGLKAAYLNRAEHQTNITEKGFQKQIKKGHDTWKYLNTNL